MRRNRRALADLASIGSSGLQVLEQRLVMTQTSFKPGSLIIDMGQATQTVGNALKPYGLVYDLVTNFRVPVQWAIDPAKTTYRLDAGNPIPYDFSATTTTGTKSYAAGSFVIEEGLVTPEVLSDVAKWKAQGVVVDELAAPLTTEIYGVVTSFPKAVLDLQNGKIAVPYYANAGVPSSSYRIGDPSNLTECDDIYIMPHADPYTWSATWRKNLYDFIDNGGGLWAGCHAVSALESLTTVDNNGVIQKLNFLSNDLIPWTSHTGGLVPYDYNPAAANDPVMQIMNRMDAALQSGSEKIYVPTGAQWRSTSTVAVYDADQANNPVGGSSPYNKAAAVVYGNAYGDPGNGLIMYEGGHSFAGTGAANIAAQRAFFNFLLLNGIGKAPKTNVSLPTVAPGQISTITASLSGGSGTYSYQWVSSSGSVFSKPAGTWKVGDPPISTQYQMNGNEDTIKLLVTDSPCGRQTVWYQSIKVNPPTLDLDGNDSTGATGADYQGYFDGNSTIVPAADADTVITAGGTTIQSAEIRLTTRPDGTDETLLIDEALANSYGITISPNGSGGYTLTGSATLAQYQSVIASLQYVNSLAYPTPTDRVIEVTVNDGSTDSNTAVSILSYVGGSPTTSTKQLYLSDPGQGLDRVDPVATGDNTTSSVAFTPVVSNDATGQALWTNTTRKNLEYRPWNLTTFGTQANTAVDGASYNTMAFASSTTRNEAVVVGVTTDKKVSGSVWNGTGWTPIKINVAGKQVTTLGTPGAAPWWGAAVAYQTGNGNAMLVWNSGGRTPVLYYSIWNGTAWSNAVKITAYTGTEPRQIRLAANPVAGSNEMVVVVTDKNEVDRALVWNGTTWGNQIQLDNNTGHNYSDLAVVYERQAGRAMVTYASGTAGNVGYVYWNGSAWSSAATISPPTGSNNYAQWTVLASSPGSNRIVLGVESNGKDAWMSVWNGTSWASSTLGVQDGVTNVNNLNIAVGFETKSGEAIAIYQNDLASTELQYKTWAPGTGTWSTGTDFGSFSNNASVGIMVNPNPFSDQIMLMVNDGVQDLRSILWSGSAMGTAQVLETSTGATTGQPFAFRWDRNAPGTVSDFKTFTQTNPLTGRLVLPSGGQIKVVGYIEVTSGTLPATPNIGARIGYNGNTIASLQSPTVTALGGGKYKLEWTSTLGSNISIPAGSSVAVTLADYDSDYAFKVLYDSATYPSQLQVATSTPIAITTKGVYTSAYPSIAPAGTATAGQPVYIRFNVNDPFGTADISGATVVIKNGSGTQVASLSLNDTKMVASGAGSKTYEVAWTPTAQDTYTVIITANEGTEGVTATAQLDLPVAAYPDLAVSKTDNGASVIPGGSVSYSISYSNSGLAPATGVVLTETLPTGATFDSAASTAGWTALGAGQYVFPVGTLNPGGSGSVTFAVKTKSVAPADLLKLLNSVTISDDGSHGPDSNPDNNQGEDTTPLNAAPDLVVTKSDGGTSTVAGGVVLYRIDYSNVGNRDAVGVVITENLPVNTTFNSSYSFGDWNSEGTSAYSIAIGDLAAGASGFVTFAVNVASPLPAGTSSILNTVSIEDSGSFGSDSNPTNNTASDTTPISADPLADLRVTKTNNVTSVHPGDTVTYTVVVTNAGPSVVTGAIFSDQIPATLQGVTYTSVTANGGATSVSSGSGNTISAALNLPVGASVTYTVTGTLAKGSTGRLTNAASAQLPSGLVDANTGNNTAIDDDPIVPISDLSMTKSYSYTDKDGSKSLTEGDEIVFTLLVTNNGPDAATNVTVMDRLPTGYLYVHDDSLAAGYTYSPGSGLWTIGTIGSTAPSNIATLHVTAIVSAGGDYKNAAEVWSNDSFDPDSTPHNYLPGEDDYSSVTPVVQPKSDLILDKKLALKDDVDTNGILSIGDRVKFTIVVRNQGPNDAPSVVVNDALPQGYSFVSATPSTGTYNSTTGVWSIGTLATLGTQTLELVATVVGNKSADLYRNQATVSSGAHDPTPANNIDSAAPSVADLSLTKTVAFADGGDVDADGTPSAGDILVFTVTVSNAGPDYASGVEVTDILNTGFAYDSDDSDGTYDSSTGIWAVGAIAPGKSRVLNVVVVINASGTYTNLAQVSKSSQFDPDSKPGNSNASEDDQASVTITLNAANAAPVAKNDESLHNPAGPVSLDVTVNDTDVNLDIDPATVDLDPSTAGIQTTLTKAGQGTWTVDATGLVTFTPLSGFKLDPTPINYTVKDAGGRVSNQATITIDYVPVASNDSSTGNTPGTAVTLNVLANDTGGDSPVASTVKIVGTNNSGDSLVVPGQGTWSVNPTTGAITFTPQTGYTGDPTPIQYTVKDAQGNLTPPATVTVDYNQRPPVATNDAKLANPPGSVTLNVTANDSDPDNDLDPGTVDLDPATPGRQSLFLVAGQGLWLVDDNGSVTFAPAQGFTADPTPISYTVSDKTGLVSNTATITIDYVPVATNDTSTGNTTGTPVTVNVLANDTTGDTVVPGTVKIVGTTNPGDPLVVPGQGTWSVNPTTGAITFTPVAGYTGDPTPIQYTVKDAQGNTSAPASVTVDYNQIAPVAVNDSKLANPAGPVSLNVTSNDTDANGDLDVATVDLDPSTPGRQTTFTTTGEGTWTVDNTGQVTFTPLSSFKLDPTPISYTVSDKTGLVSNTATITVDYVPVATNDSSAGNVVGSPVTVNVLANDTTGDRAVPGTVKIVGTTNPGDPLVVSGQGTWSINPTSGAITFTPLAGFKGDPTPIQYTVKDSQGNISAPAIVSVVYLREITSSIQARMCGVTYNRQTSLYNGSLRFTNTGTSTYSGKIKVVFTGLTSGINITSALIDTDGNPYLVLNIPSLAAGAYVDMPVSYSNPLNKALSYTLKLYTGAF